NTITVAVVGAHLTGMPLNSQLVERDAVLLEATHTAPCYRLYALANTVPPKPGLIRNEKDGGTSIPIELWQMPIEHFGSFVGLIPAPLGIGSLETVEGRWVKGFICEPWAIDDATDITELGGWRNYIATLKQDGAL
ncbi:allophanate hydrolase-related protein, partial [Alcanivorax jadensis]